MDTKIDVIIPDTSTSMSHGFIERDFARRNQRAGKVKADKDLAVLLEQVHKSILRNNSLLESIANSLDSVSRSLERIMLTVTRN